MIPSPAPFGLLITWVRTLWFVPIYTVLALVVPFLLLLILKVGFPKISAIAVNTAKSVLQQPVFIVLMCFGILAVLILPFVPYNTLGEDVKILKSQGLTLIKVLGILLAVWSAGTSVSDEIEEKTALTLLSKPISRRQLILGKFFGIVLGVSVLCVTVSTVFMPTCAYKVVYDARESCEVEPESSACLASMEQIIPGLALSFMEVVMMTAIAVALSTRLPMVPNLTLCVSIYALGHLIPLMVKSSIGQFAIIGFIGNFLSAILPVLTYYSLEAAVGGGSPITLEYLGWAALYCVLYSAVAMFVALILFEDRDLA